MAPSKPWQTQPSPQLTSRLAKCGATARENGIGLLDDAQLLANAGRFARAAALAVLAEEEFTKAYLLLNCMKAGRWDSVIWDALVDHGTKQSLAPVIQRLAGEMFGRYGALRAIDERFPIPRPRSLEECMPSSDEMENAAAEFKQLRKDRPRDRIKQRAFYVGVGQDGRVSSLPSSVGSDEWQACVSAAREVQALVELVWPGLRD